RPPRGRGYAPRGAGPLALRESRAGPDLHHGRRDGAHRRDGAPPGAVRDPVRAGLGGHLPRRFRLRGGGSLPPGGRNRRLLLRAEMGAAKATIAGSPATERPILDSSVTDRMKLLNTNNYQKGAWVLHSLRGLVGDSAFFTGLARYYRAYEHRNALSSDFARVM